MGVVRVTAMAPGSVEYLLHGCDSSPEREPVQDLDSPKHGLAESAGVAHQHGPQTSHERHGGAAYLEAATHAGEPDGVWIGTGMEALGLSMRAGDTARADDVRAIFGQMRYPERELAGSTEKTPVYIGSKPRKFRTAAQIVADALKQEPEASAERRFQIEVSAKKQTRTPTAYYDVTFSPVKSVSLYYTALLAVGDAEGANRVRDAHREAIRIAFESVERDLAYVRTGRHEGKGPGGHSVGLYEEATGLSGVVYEHHTNRDGEPQLHAHVAIHGRGAREDGSIYAIAGFGFKTITDRLTAAYTRAYQQLLTESDELVWELREDGVAREIAGFDRELLAEASTRTSDHVRPRVAELVEGYIDRHGYAPAGAAKRALVQQAVKDTRKPKTGLAGPAAVAAWAGGEPGRAVRLAAALDAVDEAVFAAAMAGTHPNRNGHSPGQEPVIDGRQAALAVLAEIAAAQAVSGHGGAAVAADMAAAMADAEAPVTVAGQVAAAVTAGVADVQSKYATWTTSNLTRAIDNRLGDHASAVGVPAGERPAFMTELVAGVLAHPAAYGIVQVSAGDPVPVPDALRRLGPHGDGRSQYRPHDDERYATTAHIAEEERLLASTRTPAAPRVSDGQLAVITARANDLGLSEDQVTAVAGVLTSGRSTDIVVGPAGTGKSHTMGALAQEWSDEVGGRVHGIATATIAARNLAGLGMNARNVRQFLDRFEPDLDTGVARERLGRRDLIVVDEAGMTPTADLVAITDLAGRAGAKVVLVGDHHQLQPVAAGGMFAHLAAQPGALELASVHRFHEPWEGDASLQLRAGDPAAVASYRDHGRLRAGTLDEMKTAAVRGHLASMLDGEKALLIVGTNDLAAELSQRVRRTLVALGRVESTELARCAGGNSVGVGDLIQARMNDYRIRVDAGADGSATPVMNKEIYEVISADPNGFVLARDERGAVAHLPKSYIAEHVTLAYAVTAHAAQGVTVDVGRGLLDRHSTRESAYVPASRGRDRNLLFLETEQQPDSHDQQRIEDTAAQRLADILSLSSVNDAALTAIETATTEEASLGHVGALINQIGGDYAHAHHAMMLDELLSPGIAADVREDTAYGRLLGAIRGAELAGHDPRGLIAEAVQMRDFTDVDSVAQVLHWRIEHRVENREPERAAADLAWAITGDDLPSGPVADYLTDLGRLAQDRQTELGRQTAIDPPAWAQLRLPEVPDPEADPAGRAAWEQRAGIVAAYREYRGIPDDQVSLGEAPPAAQQMPRALWQAAMDQLDVDPNALDWIRRDDVELYRAREAWALALYHADEYGPRAVGEDLAATHQLAAEISDDAVMTRAEAATYPDTALQRAELVEKAARFEALSERYRADAEVLEQERAARAEWWEQTAALRDADEAAAAELERRGLPAWRDRPAPERTGPQLILGSDEPEMWSSRERLDPASSLDEPPATEHDEIDRSSHAVPEVSEDVEAENHDDVTDSLQQTEKGLRTLRDQAHASRLDRARDSIDQRRAEPGSDRFDERAELDQLQLEAERRGHTIEAIEPLAEPSRQHEPAETGYADIEYDDWDE